MKDIKQLADKARESLGKYCIEECNAYCCRKGYIILSPEETKLLVKDEFKILEKEHSLRKLIDGKYSLNFSNSFGSCPSLKGSKCMNHKNENRPQTCKDFPIFIQGNMIHLSPRCFGIKEGLLYPFVRQAKQLGFEVDLSQNRV